MKISESPSLGELNTFGVEAKANLRIDIESEEDVLALPLHDPSRDLILGGGSNVLLVSDIPGTVYLNRIPGHHIIRENEKHVVVEVGGGEDWHDFVGWTVDQGFCGVENLALIPGCVGSAPIQNIGAYGVELESVVDSVTTWDLHKQRWQVFSAEECLFTYRDSLFKSKYPDRYLITSLGLRLNREFCPQVSYPALEQEIRQSAIGPVNQRAVFDAVIRIRQRKLPSPAMIGNAGSFFKNPLISQTQSVPLRDQYPEIPVWPGENMQVKLSAAWMIEHCGFKGFRTGAVGVSDQHALVLVNHGGGTGKELLELAQTIRETVRTEFDITLEPEPRIVNFN